MDILPLIERHGRRVRKDAQTESDMADEFLLGESFQLESEGLVGRFLKQFECGCVMRVG